MHHHFSHHNIRPSHTCVSIVMILVLVVGGVSAFAGSTLPCRAECCCGMMKTEYRNESTQSLQDRDGTCCHGSNSQGWVPVDCRMGPKAQPAALSLSLPSHSHSTLFRVAVEYGITNQLSTAQPSFPHSDRMRLIAHNIPINLQKSVLLC